MVILTKVHPMPITKAVEMEVAMEVTIRELPMEVAMVPPMEATKMLAMEVVKEGLAVALAAMEAMVSTKAPRDLLMPKPKVALFWLMTRVSPPSALR